MSAPHDPTFGQGLVYESRLPFAWKPLKDCPSEAQMLALNDHNETALRTILSLEEAGGEHAEEGMGSTQDLVRIEAKINLMLNLVGQLLASQSAIPPKTSVRLGAESLEWSAPKVPDPGKWVLTEIYLHPSYPLPVRLVGQTQAPAGALAAPAAAVSFAGLSEPVLDALEKLIFRHHRRMIAQARARRDDR